MLLSYIDIIYNWYSEKAFDKVSHQTLISKLYSYKMDKNIDWIADFINEESLEYEEAKWERFRVAKCYEWNSQSSVLRSILF